MTKSLVGAFVILFLLFALSHPTSAVLQTIKGGTMFPELLTVAGTAAPTFASMLIDASGEKVACIFQVPKTGILDKIEFRLGTVVQAPVNGIRVSFQDVDITNGDPDGTQDQFRNVTTGLTTDTWIVPGLMTSTGADGGTKRSVTRGNVLSWVVEFVTFATGDSLNVSGMTQGSAENLQRPYGDLFTTAWAVQTSACVFALKYDDSTYEYVATTVIPASVISTVSPSTTTTPDEVGLICQTPASMKVGGAWVRIAPAAAGRDFDVVLYDSNGSTALETVSVDADVTASTAGRTIFARFATDRTLSINTNYRLVVKPTTIGAVSIYTFSVNAAAILGAVSAGQNCHRTERTDAGAWSQTTTERPWMGLLVTALDDGVGGGGGQIIGGSVLPFLVGIPPWINFILLLAIGRLLVRVVRRA